MNHNRKSGILLPIASLPAHDIGNFGEVARRFIDQLNQAEQRIWQVLPIGPTIVHDSPFYSPSAFAINPNYIDIEELVSKKLLAQKDIDSYYRKFDIEHPNKINYGLVWKEKRALFEKAFNNFLKNRSLKEKGFVEFQEKHSYWLKDYMHFMAIKEVFMDDPEKVTWFAWDEEFRNPDSFKENIKFFENFCSQSQKKADFPQGWSKKKTEQYKKISYYADFNLFLQYIAFEQWNNLKVYANSKDVSIIGDCPIYVSPDSADVWSHQSIFKLDQDGKQECYAGVPPDYFSPLLGQFWGNPIYKWFDATESNLNEDTINWWCKRLSHQLNLFDELRIDHFRGFAGYWEIPANKCETTLDDGTVAKTAQYGSWKKGPGIALFNALAKNMNVAVNQLPIIAEDLGVITDDVKALKDALDAPGMGIYQFARWNELGWKTRTGELIPLTLETLQEIPLSTEEEWERLYWIKNEKESFLSHEFLPCNAVKTGKGIFYPGTHDNENLMGWFKNMQNTDPVATEIFLRYQQLLNKDKKEYEVQWKVIRSLYSSEQISYAIISMQDILGLDNVLEGTDILLRMNEPNKVGQWRWKMGKDQKFTKQEIQRLRNLVEETNRNQ